MKQFIPQEPLKKSTFRLPDITHCNEGTIHYVSIDCNLKRHVFCYIALTVEGHKLWFLKDYTANSIS